MFFTALCVITIILMTIITLTRWPDSLSETNNNWDIKHSIWGFLTLNVDLFLNTLTSVSDMIEVDQGQVGCLLHIITCMYHQPT